MIKKGDVPEGWSDEAADFINKVSNFFFKLFDLNVYFIVFNA